MWTHKNGNSPNAARQQIDFLFAAPDLAEDLVSIGGGIEDFPDSWEVSDHAPIVVEFQ
jgi:exonuclease III